MIYLDKDGLKVVSDLVKTGHIIKACKTPDNLIGLTLVDLNFNKNIYNIKSRSFNTCLEKLVKDFSPAVSDKAVGVPIDDFFNALILNDNFSLKVGSKVTVVESINTKTPQILFDSYYCSLSNGVVNIEQPSPTIPDGLQKLSSAVRNRFLDDVEQEA